MSTTKKSNELIVGDMIFVLGTWRQITGFSPYSMFDGTPAQIAKFHNGTSMTIEPNSRYTVASKEVRR